MNTATQTIELKRSRDGGALQPSYLARRNIWDWLFAALMLAGTAWAFVRYGAAMALYARGEISAEVLEVYRVAAAHDSRGVAQELRQMGLPAPVRKTT